MESFLFGRSAHGLAIPAFRFGTSGGRVRTLFLGGVHGDEPEGVAANHFLMEAFSRSFEYQMEVIVVPMFNPDGVLAKTRVNGNGVDLNRNLPTKDWSPEQFNPRYPPGPKAASESENQALIQLLENFKPQMVYSMHSFKKTLLNVNGDCLPEAEVIHKKTGLPIEESMGYPTPGCLGTYAGLERGWATITYELFCGMPLGEIRDQHIPALLEALTVTEKRNQA